MGGPGVLIDQELGGRLDPSWVEHLASFAVTSPNAPRSAPPAPFTGEPLATLPMSAPEDVAVAYAGARAVQPSWAYLPVAARAAILLRFHDLLLAAQVELCDLIQLETGKSRRSAFEEVVELCTACRFYARTVGQVLAERRHFGTFPLITQVVVSRRPVGVVGVIAPAAAPLSAGVADAVAALVAGNTVVLRPHSRSSLAALRAAELLQRAGCPPRVLQLVLGPGDFIGTRVVDEADYVCFTGSPRVARWVAARAAGRLVPANVQVIGSGAAYIAPDAPLERAAEGVTRALTSVGSSSCYVSRVLVHRQVAAAFTELLAGAVGQVRLGPQLSYDVTMGSTFSPEHRDAALARIEAARAHGARLLAGGRARPDLGPCFVEPAVLECPPGAPAPPPEPGPLPGEAAAGLAGADLPVPVALLSLVGTETEAVRALSAARDGDGVNTAYLWTRDRLRPARVARRAEAGTVIVNGHEPAMAGGAAPAGGGRGGGLGRRHGIDGILACTQTHSIAVRRGPASPWRDDERTAAAVTAALRLMRVLGRR